MPSNFQHRFTLSRRLLGDIFRLLPKRGTRWVGHFSRLRVYVKDQFLYGLRLKLFGRILLWAGEGCLLFFDLLGMPEWYELANCWLKSDCRPLNPEERRLAESIFGNSLPYHRLRLDERAYIGPKQYKFCYVSFCVINSWEAMPPAILVHELVHIWQFAQYGSPYLLRALLAQRSPEGYDYGGVRQLHVAVQNNSGLSSFNYEQQASIIEDYFRLHQLDRTRWASTGNKQHLVIYRCFVKDLQQG